MKSFAATLAATMLCGVLCGAPARAVEDRPPPGPDRGWTWLVDKLVTDGLARERVVAAFADPRVPPFTGLEFSIAPRESRALYSGFLRPASVAAARRCRSRHAALFLDAERTHGVPASVVAAILHIETGCGVNTGSSPVLYRLARLAMANEPGNVRDNIDRLSGFDGPDAGLEGRVRARAQYLEDTFYPEVRATFEMADRLGLHPLSLRGSGSGAIGVPQFLPTSFLRYGTDAGGDGAVDLYDLGDAAASCANYLAAHGWKPGLSVSQRRAIIWRYNRSDAYIDAVLTLARQIEQPAPVPTVRAKAGPTKRTGRAKKTVARARNARS